MNLKYILADIETQIHALGFELTDAIARHDAASESRIRFGIGLLVNLRTSLTSRKVAA